MPILEISQLSIHFGGVVALDDVALSLRQASIHAVIGPNGAGKSTLLNVITGLYHPTRGQVRFSGEDITRLRPHEICRKGISRSFQNTELFGEMSAIDNVKVGMHSRPAYGLMPAITHFGKYRRIEAQHHDEAMQLLARVGLEDDAQLRAASLPFGKQRRLEIARALASRPRLLLLDEPAAGLRSAEIDELNDILLGLRDSLQLSILVIDHVMALVMNISDYITVLNFGHKIAEGLPEEVRGSPEVIRAYLGERAAHAQSA